ncbi:MAG TPA: hypothetical protein VKV26_23460 [Dehalococcoidia bacterium]|nr:hypothetical protein [Dehalococcoidia bacterium]
MPKAVWLVATKCTDPAREEEFNRWYDGTHLPDLLSVPHITAARRFKLSGPANPKEPDAQYLAIYEIDSETPEAVTNTALQEHDPKWRAAGRMIDCIQASSLTTFRQIGKHADSTNTAKAVFLVKTACADPARDAEFNRWYDDVHIPDVTSVPGVIRAQRYKLAGQPSKTEPEAQYLAVYELDTDDTKTVSRAIGAKMPEWTAAGRVIDCLKVVSAVSFVAAGARQQAKAAAAGD